MVLVDSGKNRVRDLIKADLTIGKLGTSGTDPSVNATDLGSVDATTSATLTNTTGNKLINSEHVLLSTIGNSTTYKEFATYLNSGTVLFDYVVYPDFLKSNTLELHTISTLRVD